MTAAGGGAHNSKLNTDGCGNGAAGTLFYKTESKLVIDNENKLTPKKTVLTARQNQNEKSPAIIAKTVLIDGGADVWIDSHASNWLQFNDLELTGDVTLGIVSSNSDMFTLSLGDNIVISKDSLIDLSRIYNAEINATNWMSEYQLGHVHYAHVLKVHGGHV